MSMINSIDTIGNRARDLSGCSAVHQPTAPPAACRMLPQCRTFCFFADRRLNDFWLISFFISLMISESVDSTARFVLRLSCNRGRRSSDLPSLWRLVYCRLIIVLFMLFLIPAPNLLLHSSARLWHRPVTRVCLLTVFCGFVCVALNDC